MTGYNLQVRIPEALHKSLVKLAPRKKSVFVRDAIAEKIRRETERRMENRWIEALKLNPQDAESVGDWVKSQAWSGA